MKSCFWTLALLLPLAIYFGGCAAMSLSSGKNEKWNSRIGHYTYDEMIVSHGPPASKEKLDNGNVVAEWVLIHNIDEPAFTTINTTSPNTATALTIGGGTTQMKETMILTFDGKGILKEWHWSMR